MGDAGSERMAAWEHGVAASQVVARSNAAMSLIILVAFLVG